MISQTTPCYWFIFYRDMLLLRPSAQGEAAVPLTVTPPLPSAHAPHFAGLHLGVSCFAYAVDALPENSGWVAVGLRAAFDVLGRPLYLLAGKGYQLLYWDTHSRFCPVCGTKTAPSTSISKRCPSCGHEQFPPISTAVLVLVQKEDSALLVRSHNFKGPNHGLVAGFLEPGETLEECVQREVREETSLSIDAIRYFGCQPWPYPSGLMVGFTADYRAGEIILQQEELSSAAFFTRDRLPTLPNPLSLARRMIDWWIDGEGGR